MYNLWWITIALTVVVVTGIFLCIFTDEILQGIGAIITLLFGIALLVVFIISIANPIIAKNEYNEFIETRTMVEQVYSGDYTELENAGLNNEIIEVNKWLAKAKASKKQWGNWSMYYALDLDSLDYIVLKKVESGGE